MTTPALPQLMPGRSRARQLTGYGLLMEKAKCQREGFEACDLFFLLLEKCNLEGFEEFLFLLRWILLLHFEAFPNVDADPQPKRFEKPFPFTISLGLNTSIFRNEERRKESAGLKRDKRDKLHMAMSTFVKLRNMLYSWYGICPSKDQLRLKCTGDVL